MKIMTISKRFKIGILPIIFIFVILASFNGCKGFGIPDWELEITFEEGVDGTPPAGTYAHKELTVIEYNFYPLDSAHSIEVSVNGNQWPLAGEFVMYTNLKVVVRVFDIRGTWNVTIKETETESEEEIEFNITFSGADVLSGDFTDDRGYSGTWEIVNDDLTISYSDWPDRVLTGTVPRMSGDYWTGDVKSGTWSAQRVE
ncbi:MAG: hypothetical protein JSV88_15940 [Candidatus Aminicenantes bacterium]|nr:MAG: hypothetical protein JSV88_15940 [Candidatus Aminicenantes bacterium]